MSQCFTLIESKNCRKYTKYVYRLNKQIDFDLIESLHYFGKAEVTEFSKYNSNSLDMFKIRNYELACEIAGSINGNDLIVTMDIKDDKMSDLIESEITEWFNKSVPEDS